MVRCKITDNSLVKGKRGIKKERNLVIEVDITSQFSTVKFKSY